MKKCLNVIMGMKKRMENKQNRIDENTKHDVKRQKNYIPSNDPGLQRISGG